MEGRAMTAETTDLQALRQRLERVERESRRLKCIGVVVLAGIVGAVLMGQAKANRVVQAEKFVVQDASGRARAELGAAPDGRAALVFFDRNGRSRIELRILPDDRVGLLLQGKDEKPLAALRVLPDGRALLAIYDKEERLHWQTP
jgi:hypothetical protein